ncbi:MAG: extracellular solute-binding protein [Opitutales bacterium]|nr:extracellular solute-binding protein [Opitutales bacterium]
METLYSIRCFGRFAFFLAAVLFAGCGRPDGASGGGRAPEQGEAVDGHIEILVVGDPFAGVLERHQAALSAWLGDPLRLNVRRYARTHDEILSNAGDASSFFHLVSFDVLWLPQLVRDGILSPLSPADLAKMGRSKEEFFPITWEVNREGGQVYGLPIQPHMELLWYRRDLLDEAGFTPPRNLDELLVQARYFHNRETRLSGVGWNALRGQALGQTVAHTYAAMGEPFIDEDGEVRIDTPTGLAVIEFLRELREVSPADIMSMAWDQRVERFRRGQLAFTYGWAARAFMVERDPLSRVAGQVGYLPAPARGNSQRGVTPFGQWSLGIPANLPEAERERALRTLALFSSERVWEVFVADGLVALQRRPPANRAVPPAHSAQAVSEAILEAGAIDPRARPTMAAWSEVAELLGVYFHDALLGRMSPQEALRSAQEGAEVFVLREDSSK